MINKIENLILGAGVSGISAACFIDNGNYLILESEDSIGGYCRTIYQDDFIWDYSGHFFHFKDPLVKELVFKNISNDDLINVKKKTAIYYKDKYINFPFQSNICELSKEEFLDCLYDYYFRAINDSSSSSNFLNWLYSNLGKSITDKFIKPYNEKLYACSLEKLDIDAMGRFFPKVSLDDIIGNIKFKSDQSYNNNFLYPKFGAIYYINSIAKNLDQDKILLNHRVTKVDTDKKIVYCGDVEFHYKKLINTIPLNNFMRIANIDFDEKIYSYNQVLVYNMGFDKPFNHDFHWIYYPGPEVCFYRVGFYSNIIMQPRGSIYVEIGFNQFDNIRTIDYKDIIINDLKKINLITDHKLVSDYSLVMNPAYIHLSTESINDSKLKINNLKQKDIYCVGRYAEWTYCSIEDNIISARNTVNDFL